jgi:hypothetical protein
MIRVYRRRLSMAKTKKINAVEFVAEKGYPEVGYFSDQKELQKFYKQLPTDVLEDWASVEGWTYKPCPESEPIHRMRVAMAILYGHFPKAPAKSKKKSKYSEYSLADLMQMCLDEDVPVEYTESEQIMRMRAIMALRAHKVID